MINITRMYKKFSSGLTMLDWAIIKIDLIVLGLLLAKLFPVLTSLHWGWYVGFIVLVEIYLIHVLKRTDAI